MYLVQKAFYLWLGILITLLIIHSCAQKKEAAVYLPVPATIVSITLPDEITLTRQAVDAAWYVNKQLANQAKVNEIIRLFKQPCRAKYAQQSINTNSEHKPLAVSINEEDYLFGAHQELSHTHYIYHQQDVYLCHESIKYYLTQPLAYWIAKE